jgi:hypothetical protein
MIALNAKEHGGQGPAIPRFSIAGSPATCGLSSPRVATGGPSTSACTAASSCLEELTLDAAA